SAVAVQAALERFLAPGTQHLRDRNPHRADLLAAPAQRRGLGQRRRMLDADQRRRGDGADRPGIDPAVRMAADVMIDRAVVEAGAAADAAQHLLELGAEQLAAA